jgi:hypothetical protein
MIGCEWYPAKTGLTRHRIKARLTFSIGFIRIGLSYPAKISSIRLSGYSYEQDHHLR